METSVGCIHEKANLQLLTQKILVSNKINVYSKSHLCKFKIYCHCTQYISEL